MSMMRRSVYAGLIALLIGSFARAAPVDVPLPAGAELLRQQQLALGTLVLPTGPAQGDTVPSKTYEGRIYRRSWRIVADLTVLQVFAPVRDYLLAEGFEDVFSCQDRLCGGFSFRFGIDVIPAPDMSVNLSDFMFLSARQPDTGVVLSVLVSRTADVVSMQLLEREDPDTPPETPPVSIPETSKPVVNALTAGTTVVQSDPRTVLLEGAVDKSQALSTGDVGDLLQLQGHVPLLDLEFSSGSDRMGGGPFDSLRQLAAFMKLQGTAQILLVGHTDTVGTLNANVELSRRRAASVRARLIERYGIDGDRISVAGAGFMSPLASNATAEGREINRRVEAVLVTP